MALAETSLGNLNHGAGAAFPSWKLYNNPHYYLSRGRGDRSCVDVSSSFSPSRSPRRKDQTSMIVATDDGSMEQLHLAGEGGYVGGVVSVLELVARVEELGAELEFERRMRRKVESLNEALAAELAEERRRGEAERARVREETERALEEAEEERRVLRVAELWREERVRMKLADARDAVEEKLREIADAGAGHRAADAIAYGCNCRSSGGGGSPVGKSSPASQQAQQSPTSGHQHGQLHRREAATGGGGGENPHITRGIKGFVEFPRAVRVRPRGEERADLVSNLECQRAQLRVLMGHRSPAAGMGLVGAPRNLVV